MTKTKQGETVGKSKLEKETGTVNDRIFEVLPNYGTVENSKELPPLTTGQKFRLATARRSRLGRLSVQRYPSPELHKQRMILRSGARVGTRTEKRLRDVLC